MKARYLLAAGLAMLILLAAYLLRDFAREFILIPVEYIFWLASIVYRTFPQLLWWGLFVLGLFYIAIKSLAPTGQQQKLHQRIEEPPLSRAGLWSRWIATHTQGNYFRWRLAHELLTLLLDVLAYQERTTHEQVKEDLLAGKLDLPADILGYFQAALLARSYRHYLEMKDEYRRSGRPSFEVSPERVVDFLESKMAG